MSNQPKKAKICTICCKPIQAKEASARSGRGVWVHLDCFQAEQRELKAEKEDANK